MAKRFADIDLSDWKTFLRDLRKIDPELRKEFVAQIRGVLGGIVSQAQSAQPVVSGKLRKGIKASVRAKSLAIVSSSDHGRQKEFGGHHPLFGNTKYWYADKGNEAVFEAVQRNAADVERRALQAMDEAARRAGFK